MAGFVNKPRNAWRNMLYFFGIMARFLRFIWKQKAWWLVPMILLLLSVGLMVFLSQSPEVAPFVYTLF